MPHDLVIRRGTIIDGSGAPAYRGDIAINQGRITEIGEIHDGADRVIDASDLIVAPGFIDPHTHYDAQVAWDPLITCSSWHGITTVVMGNCGVGVAPVKPELRDVLMWDLVNVEAIPFEVLQQGISWQWESHKEYLDAIQKRGIGINVASLAALTPLRHYVMGEESFERAANAEEI